MRDDAEIKIKIVTKDQDGKPIEVRTEFTGKDYNECLDDGVPIVGQSKVNHKEFILGAFNRASLRAERLEDGLPNDVTGTKVRLL